jgi:hypothetical protein
LIYGVEHLRKMRDFKTEAERFNEHPGNRGCLRRQLRIRISTNRLKRLIRTTLQVPAAATQQSSGEEAA